MNLGAVQTEAARHPVLGLRADFAVLKPRFHATPVLPHLPAYILSLFSCQRLVSGTCSLWPAAHL